MATKLTKAEGKRLDQLLSKALNKDRASLSVAEVKELQKILTKLETIKEEAFKKEDHGEVIDSAIQMGNIKLALETNEDKEKAFSELDTSEKIKEINSTLDRLENSKALKELGEKLDFEKFYSEHAKKFGNEI